MLNKTLLALAAAAVMTVSGQVSAQSDEPLKVGFVYVSPIGDAGWTYQHELGRQAMEESLGDKVESKYIESVPEGSESERVIRQFAADDYGLVFTTSFGYMNPTLKVAKRYPDVKFEHVSGYKRAKNVGTVFARLYEGRYLSGIVAGEMTESNTLGYVAAFPIPEVLRGINAFTLGARSVNPDAQVKVIWTNSWFDPGREREAADALLAQGADVLTHHTDSTAIVQAAQEKGAKAIAYHSDMSKYGQDAQLAAVTHHWGRFYTEIAQQVIDGTWESKDIWAGMDQDMVELSALNDSLPDEVKQMVNEKADAIKSGELHPFQGPVVDQSGETKVAEGETMSDQDMLTMEYYVEGVQGKLPK